VSLFGEARICASPDKTQRHARHYSSVIATEADDEDVLHAGILRYFAGA